jgi:hypothetical protein
LVVVSHEAESERIAHGQQGDSQRCWQHPPGFAMLVAPPFLSSPGQ